jgi:hypothetical protein
MKAIILAITLSLIANSTFAELSFCTDIDWKNSQCDTATYEYENSCSKEQRLKLACKTAIWEKNDTNPEYILKTKRTCNFTSNTYEIKLRRKIHTIECYLPKPIKYEYFIPYQRTINLIAGSCFMQMCIDVPFFRSCTNYPVHSLILENIDSIKNAKIGINALCKENIQESNNSSIEADLQFSGKETSIKNNANRITISGKYTNIYGKNLEKIQPNRILPEETLLEYKKRMNLNFQIENLNE